MNRTEKIAAKVATTDAWVKAHANGGDLKADIEYLLASNAAAESKLAECAEALHLAEGNAKAIAKELERNGEDVPLGLWSIHHAARRVLSSLSALPKDSSEAEGKIPDCVCGRLAAGQVGECHECGEVAPLAKEAGEKTCSICGGKLVYFNGQYDRCENCSAPTPSEPQEKSK